MAALTGWAVDVVARSASVETPGRFGPDEVREWFSALAAHTGVQVNRAPLDGLEGWDEAPGTGDIGHHSGGFFNVRGLQVRDPDNREEPGWSQPIIDQPEIGVLGILIKEFDGVPYLLMQAKMEPGNVNLIQLSPTVQATRSNYTGVHRGRSVPYVEYFLDPPARSVLADSLQSEQGSWFLRKHNRNMVVLAGDEDVPLREGFCWLTLKQVHELLAEDDLVNMDTRTVLSCLPSHTRDPDDGALLPMSEILSTITAARSRTTMSASPVPLRTIEGWHRTAGEIRHREDRHFRVIGVDVATRGREVRKWSQPMIEPRGLGLAAVVTRRANGVPHLLLRTTAEPGLRETVELGPTLQLECEDEIGSGSRRSWSDGMSKAAGSRILFDAVQSEEGGRFFHARTRNLVVERGERPLPEEDLPDHLWVSLPQVDALLRHSHYLNIQARSLVACVRSLSGLHGSPADG